MTVMPAEIAYGYVDARIILASADGPDAGRLPDPQPATGTTIKVTPKTQIVRTTGEAVPTLIAKQPVTCEVDSDGYLVDSQGARGVWLVTGVYTVAYSSPAASIPGHDIEVLSTHTETAPLNLVNAMPPGGPVLSASEYAELSARIDALPGGSGAVSSVNGKTGAVVLNAADVSALPSTYTPPDQSWTQITGKPTTFPPATHTHTTADVTDIDMVTTPPADGHVLTYLAVSGKWEPRFPAAPSWASITGKPATFPPSAHTHAAADVTSGVLAPARLGTGTASASTVLYGDGTWKTAPSGGGGGFTPTVGSKPGALVTPQVSSSNSGTDTWRQDRAYAFPVRFYPASGGSIIVTAAAVQVSAAVAASTIRVGLYSSTIHGEMDGASLVTEVAIPSTSTGLIEAALPAPVTLTPGIYWAVTVTQGGVPAFRRAVITESPGPVTSANSPGLFRNGITGALPTTGTWSTANETDGVAWTAWRVQP